MQSNEQGLFESDTDSEAAEDADSGSDGYDYGSYPRYDDAELEDVADDIVRDVAHDVADAEADAEAEASPVAGSPDDEAEDQGEERPWYGRSETSGPGRITVQFIGEEDMAVEESEHEPSDEEAAESEEAWATEPGASVGGPADEPAGPEMDDTAVDPARHVTSEVTAEATEPTAPRPETDGAPVVETPRVPTEDPDNPEAFGRWLRSQRELRGIALRAIADSSKISLGYLRDLEAGRFDLLPAEVFTKGFLRQYAGYVGLDPEEAINFYLAARDHVEEVDLDPMLIPSPPKEASSGIRWVVATLLLAALLLGVVWLLRWMSENRRLDGAGPEASRSAATVPEDAVPGDAAADDAGGDPDSGSSAEDRSGDASVGNEGPVSAGQTSGRESPASAPAAPESAVVSEPTSPLRVVLDFSDTCWVSAVIDDGETREKVHAQGESLTLDARRTVELKVGNYRAVDVEVNGMPYDLRSRGRPNTVVRTVRIDLSALDSAGLPAESPAVPGAAD